MADHSKHIAIIGAGISGLACASLLDGNGHLITLYDKGRGPGGRMSSRRVQLGKETISFDHGCQYFTAEHPSFVSIVSSWAKEGLIEPWKAAGEEAWVGVPTMSALVRYLAADKVVYWNNHITYLEKKGQRWIIHSDKKKQAADVVIIAVPSEQVASLLKGASAEHGLDVPSTVSYPCWSVMVSFSESLPIARDFSKIQSNIIATAARNSNKPDRKGNETWVLHATSSWSEKMLLSDSEAVAEALLKEFLIIHEVPPLKPNYLSAHRWRFAFPQTETRREAIWNEKSRIGLCGDYLVGPRVEGAWLSGERLAAEILKSFDAEASSIPQ